MKVLFRVDAGPQIGLGHVQRCLSLATALSQFDVTCLFLTNEDPTSLERVGRFGFEGHTVKNVLSWGEEDLEHTLATASVKACSAIIVDSDYEGAEYLNGMRSAGYFVVAIEDTVPHPFPCHMVVNGDAHARQLQYHSPFEDTDFLLGPEYSILRREFWEVPESALSESVDNILVTLGGSDPYNIMPRVIDLLDKLPEIFEITAIIGPFFENIAEVQAAAERARRVITLVESPDSVIDLMLQADLAISAGGQTLYELARVGCPTIALRIASNQDGQMGVFEEEGFLLTVGHGDHGGIIEAIYEVLGKVLTDTKTRSAMSAAGKRLIDGKGALRVARTILELVSNYHSTESL